MDRLEAQARMGCDGKGQCQNRHIFIVNKSSQINPSYFGVHQMEIQND
jgi:hypothetical protein